MLKGPDVVKHSIKCLSVNSLFPLGHNRIYGQALTRQRDFEQFQVTVTAWSEILSTRLLVGSDSHL